MSTATEVEATLLKGLLQMRGQDALPSLDKSTPLGAAVKPAFSIDPKDRSMNYGSFGCPPLEITAHRIRLAAEVDASPETHLRDTSAQEVKKVREQLAAYLNVGGKAAADNVFLVDNAADAFNTVAQSYLFNPQYTAQLPPKEGPLKVLLFTTTYPMVPRTIMHHNSRAAAQKANMMALVPSLSEADAAKAAGEVEVVTFEVTATHMNDEAALIEDIVAKVKTEKIDFVVLDHIVSPTGMVMPLVALARRIKLEAGRHVFVAVDGAHAVGQIRVNFSEFVVQEDEGANDKWSTVDAYFSNCHKWLMAPKSSAVLVVEPALHKYLHPTVISNCYQDELSATPLPRFAGLSFTGGEEALSRAQAEFFWKGTRDPSVFVALGKLIEWRANLGEERIIDYIHELGVAGAKEAARIWGTEVLIKGGDHRMGAMATVRAPTDSIQQLYDAIAVAQREHHSFAAAFNFNGIPHVRFCAQIYMTIDDYRHHAETLLAILEKSKTSA